MIHCKRYLARAGDRYYPSESGNVVGIFDTVNEALDTARAYDGFISIGMRWVSVFDLLKQQVVAHESDYETINGRWESEISQEMAEDGDKA